MRIVVSGALANKPGYGGEAWVRLTWVRGLQALGARVMFVEEMDLPLDDHGEPAGEGHPGITYFRDVCEAFGLEGSASLVTPGGTALAGEPVEAVRDFAADADLLVNISGNLTCPEVFDAVRHRAYVDLDPGYTHLWHAAGVSDLGLREHDIHFTVGTNLGTSRCNLPTSGIRWIPVVPPVLLDDWPVVPPPDTLRFTTVASWRGAFGRVSQGGHSYGLKAHEFRKVAELPRHVPHPFEIALDIHESDEADRHLMEGNGWVLEDPRTVAGTPDAFRRYVARSGAEFSVAQGVYVEARSGWFSDRSAHYLASGRPVVIQDTGIQETLPVGAGILCFRTPDEARVAVDSVALDPDHHGESARQVAEEYLDARTVLARFLDQALPRVRSGPRAKAPARAPGASRSGRGGQKDPTVLVSGMVARVPDQGGATWATLQYVLGLRRMGRDVVLVEEVDPQDLLPRGVSLAGSRNAASFRRVVRIFGLSGQACMVLRGTHQTVGLPWDEVKRRVGTDAVLLNLSGTLRDPELRSLTAVQVYLDLDPAFTQIWHEDGEDVGLEGHTHFATVGLELGRPGCPVPQGSVSWIHTLPPVALDAWTPGAALERDALTTVANWRGYGSVRWKGVEYGQKAHAFRPLFGLPRRLDRERFEVALAIHRDEQRDLAGLEENGWHVLDPVRVAGTPELYRSFVRGSAAELGVAKAGYVQSRCGWFSDRSACYLAAGRPVVAQDTGFSRHLPCGEGLLVFTTADEAVEATQRVRARYAEHARAARRVAEEHFDARRVLSRLLRRVAA